MAEIQVNFDKDWGESGNQWSGDQVQKFLKETLQAIIAGVNPLIKWYESFPETGDTYGLCGRKPELISLSGEAVMNQTIADAATLAEESLKRGALVTVNEVGQDLGDEVRALLPEDVLAELEASAVATMDEAVKESVEERLAKAVAEYRQRKAFEKAEMERMLEKAELKRILEMAEAEAEAQKGKLEKAENAEAEELDVEPNEGKEE